MNKTKGLIIISFVAIVAIVILNETFLEANCYCFTIGDATMECWSRCGRMGCDYTTINLPGICSWPDVCHIRYTLICLTGRPVTYWKSYSCRRDCHII